MLRFLIAALALALGLVVVSVSNCGSECSADKDCEEVVCADGTKHRTCTEGSCMTFADCPSKQSGW